jgi:hypothetical protein
MERSEPSEWKFAWFWFFEARAVLFFNNLEEVQPRHERFAWRGWVLIVSTRFI